MISIDTNILLYARIARSPFHRAARTYLESISESHHVAIAELVLVELYLALRNPTLFSTPLTASQAVKECHYFRNHPKWQLIENADVMNDVWKQASHAHFSRRKIIDVRFAKTLQAHGVTEFVTANTKDFENLGFKKVWSPC